MDGEIRHDRVSGVGSALRACRLKHGIPLADVARALRIRQSFLAAIEDGRFSDLPGTPYAVGFARTYGEFLGLDGDEVVRRLRDEIHAPGGSAELHFPSPTNETSAPRSGILLVGALIAVLAYGGWYLMTANKDLVSDLAEPLPDRLGELLTGTTGDDAATPPAGATPVSPLPETWGGARSASPTDAPAPTDASRPSGSASSAEDSPAREPGDAPAGAEAVAPAHAATGRPNAESAPPAPAEVRAQAEPAAAAPPPPEERTAAARTDDAQTPAASPATSGDGTATAEPTGGDERPQIVIRATEASWVEIRDRRGRRVTGRLMQPGESYDVPEQSGLTMTVGNAGGVSLSVDGKVLPPLGESGVVRRSVSLDPESIGTTATP